jgi:hypothetical protein
LKRSWTEPAVIWSAVIAESGSMKTPAYVSAIRHLRQIQHECFAEYNQACEKYERDLLEFEVALAAWKKKVGLLPEKPVKPVCRRFLADNITIESLALLLYESPHGLLVGCDELGSWLGSFNAYRQGRGGDLQRWLEMFSAGCLIIDRKSSKPNTIHVPRAAVSVTGAIQPGIARRLFVREFFEAGLVPRFLLAMPPHQPYRWTDAEVDAGVEKAFESVLRKLTDLECEQGTDDTLQPVTHPLSAQAKRLWVEFVEQETEDQTLADGDLAALGNKTRGYAARLALLIHLVRCAADDSTIASPHFVDADSITAGVGLARWFRQEGERVYAILSAGQDAEQARKLVELIRRKGGQVSARELRRSCRQFRHHADAAEEALNDLVQAGLGHWVLEDHDGQRGRPTQVFELLDGRAGAETQNPSGNAPFLAPPDAETGGVGAEVRPGTAGTEGEMEWAG